MTVVTDATLGARGLWLGTRTGASGTATLTESFFGRRLWLHGQQVQHNYKKKRQEHFNDIPDSLRMFSRIRKRYEGMILLSMQ